MIGRWLLGWSLLLVMLLGAGCRAPASPTPTAMPIPTPTPWVVKTVIGEGRGLEGPLVIDGSCVRVNGQALAWSRAADVRVEGDTFRFQNWDGEVVVFHAGDQVMVYGGCEYRDIEGIPQCVTPTLDEAQAISTCDTGPYFITFRIRKLQPPPTLPPLHERTCIMMTNRLILVGFGSVHRSFAQLLLDKQDVLAQRYGLRFAVVGVADSGGALVRADGLDLAALLAHKAAGESVATFPGGEPLPDALTLAQTADYDLLLEASPVNLTHGDPALSCVRAALSRGKAAVLANKAPLVLDFAGLHALAREHDAGLAFSATVCGGLPVINVGQRDLVAADIHKVEGIFNSTSNYILTRMAAGERYEDALAEAQRRGLAETDPSLDVDGWDTANKLVIIANAVLGLNVSLEDVQVTGIRDLSGKQIARAREEGQMVRLIATAERLEDGWRLEVRPRMVTLHSFLGSIDLWEMGIIFHTDIFEDIYLKVDERGPTATAAAVLRDTVHLASLA